MFNSTVAKKKIFWKAGNRDEIKVGTSRQKNLPTASNIWQRAAKLVRLVDLRLGTTDTFKIAKQVRKENQFNIHWS